MQGKPQPPEQPSALFSLRAISRALSGFKPPTGEFDPQGPWEHEYRIVTLASIRDEGAVHNVGQLTMRRTPLDRDRFRLEISTHKPLQKANAEQMKAEMICRNDLLATPISWSMVYRLSDAGQTIEGTDMALEGQIQGTEAVLKLRERTLKKPLTMPVSTTWGILDAVQRMAQAPGAPAKPVDFTLIDHFDQIKPGHSLAYRRRTVIELGGYKAVRKTERQLDRGVVVHHEQVEEGGIPTVLHSYEQLGWGVVPLVFWTDETGRLLFVISGLEAYIWKAGGAR